jgi:hypothetical protein
LGRLPRNPNPALDLRLAIRRGSASRFNLAQHPNYAIDRATVLKISGMNTTMQRTACS